MNRAERNLQASFWLMIVFQTIGSIDLPNSKNHNGLARKLPAPKQYVAIVVLWATLHLIADTGRGRAASAMGWVFVLTGLVVGPFSKTLVNFLNNVAQLFPVNKQANESEVPQATPSTLTG